ncbi:ABC-2 transporter permease [Paenibacillus flagellatus]|nr:ABC-2 transporter permease [Paenibacillus flagellatus]
MWDNVWLIVKYDLKRSRWGLLVSVLMYAYFCFFTVFITREQFPLDPAETAGRLGTVADIMLLTSMSCVGFAMTGDYRVYWRSDIFSKRLLFLRQLPISVRELVAARYVLIAINTAMLSVLYFVPLFLFGPLGRLLTPLQIVSFALTWVAFGVCMSVMYAYKELAGSGKSYFLYCCVWAILLIAIPVLTSLLGFGFVESSVEAVKRYGALVPVIGAVVAAVWVGFWFRKTERRIRSRSFSR